MADGEGKQSGKVTAEVSVLGFFFPPCILTVWCVFLADVLDTTGLFSQYCALSGPVFLSPATRLYSTYSPSDRFIIPRAR